MAMRFLLGVLEAGFGPGVRPGMTLKAPAIER